MHFIYYFRPLLVLLTLKSQFWNWPLQNTHYYIHFTFPITELPKKPKCTWKNFIMKTSDHFSAKLTRWFFKSPKPQKLSLKLFSFFQCDYFNHRKSEREIHYLRVHVKEKRFMCDKCDFRALLRGEMDRHVREVSTAIDLSENGIEMELKNDQLL